MLKLWERTDERKGRKDERKDRKDERKVEKMREKGERMREKAERMRSIEASQPNTTRPLVETLELTRLGEIG